MTHADLHMEVRATIKGCREAVEIILQYGVGLMAIIDCFMSIKARLGERWMRRERPVRFS